MKCHAAFLVSAVLGVSVLIACSSSSSDGASPGAGSGDSDSGVVDDSDGGGSSTDGATTPTTKIGDDCTATAKCSTGQVCIDISAGGQAICLASCKGGLKCPGAAECDNGICTPVCSQSGNGCPAAMECITDLGQCEFSCVKNPKLCGPGLSCEDGTCAKAVPDAGPLLCKSGGGAASSGILGTKTVGGLTTTEQATFCDWAAAITGGYGCKSPCDGGASVGFVGSRSACTSEFTKPSCNATISDVETCLKENAVDVCNLAILDSANCASLRACL